MDSLGYNIVNNLTPDLLNKHYAEQDHPLSGHCYVASETYYHLSPDKKKLVPVYCSYRVNEETGTHWWLENKETGERIDLTAKQFDKDFRNQLYSKGQRSGFLTKRPCKRTQKLIDIICNHTVNNLK